MVDGPDPGKMSLTRTVPAVVPSDFQSSSPCTGSVALKYTVPFTLVKPAGLDAAVEATALMSATRYGFAGLTRGSNSSSRGRRRACLAGRARDSRIQRWSVRIAMEGFLWAGQPVGGTSGGT